MTDETISAPVAETPAAQPPVTVQDDVKVETPEQKPEGAQATPDTAKEDVEASEAAKKLNERKQQKASRYRDMERQMHDAVRKTQQLEARIAEYEKIAKPDPAKFSDISDYDAENAKFAAAQLRKSEASFEVNDLKQEAERVKQSAYTEAVTEFRHDNPDFDPGVFIRAAQGAPYAEQLAEAIIDEPDTGVQIMAALSKTPGEIARIAALPPRAQLRELARIEANLTRSTPVRVTQAPEPVKAVSGNSSTSSLDPSKMNEDQYAAWFKARKANKR